ncbi:hypothetical protein OUZ56_020824 [Daphnia magna]|uniref:Uncharacterized protein n=1 Tax=Daphnia magna TaxID=35525 RepID=A0ABQ9ZFJ4_9CRUS|nr:hypothetical protein OUZ56_020824 [Daphnia magna]
MPIFNADERQQDVKVVTFSRLCLPIFSSAAFQGLFRTEAGTDKSMMAAICGPLLQQQNFESLRIHHTISVSQ